MKPLWTPTIAWIVAVLIAVLAALATADGAGDAVGSDLFRPQGAMAPR